LALELSLKYAVFHGALRLHDFEVGVMARIYQPLMTFGPRKLKPKFCSIVRLNSYAPEAGLWQTRDQLRRVLERVLTYEPSAVVADFSLQRIGTGYPHGETGALLAAVHAGCDKTPIIFGYDIGAGPKVLPHEPIEPKGDTRWCSMGYTNPGGDMRVVPLTTLIEGLPHSSVAWATVRLVKPSLTDDPDILWSLNCLDRPKLVRPDLMND
jgi:hypothetical protein